MDYITKAELDANQIPWDSAIPQELFDDILDKTGTNPSSHVVFSYPSGLVFGQLQAIDPEGAEILKAYGIKNEC